MKTPKEKAKELVQKMFNTGSALYAERIRAKQCALIAIDEILNSNPKEFGNIINALKYWQEVKTEITNL